MRPKVRCLILSLLIISLFLFSCQEVAVSSNEILIECSLSEVWNPDLGNGYFKNPIIHADYSDPDVVRVGDDYFMTASSFNCVPGLPILYSKDLVNWRIVNYAMKRQIPEDVFNKPQHGNGVWAPAIRYHQNYFYIFYGDPDFGIYMVKTQDPFGEWSTPYLVKSGKGWIDPCPFWDNNGKAYLIHAFAGSRAGIKSVLIMHQMSEDGTMLLDDGTVVFDGHINNPIVEGPKLYKKDGFYYIFAPAGGVSTGWQLVLRARDIFGAYEEKKVLHQGNTSINGPHQGAWINTITGEDWFIHFQDKEAYGRVVHLQPMHWNNGWPVIGVDTNKDGIGEPVYEYVKPSVGKEHQACDPQASDEFDSPKHGLQWQWQANPDTRFGYPSGRLGYLRLNALPKPGTFKNLWGVPNLYLQKFTSEEFSATAKIDFFPQLDGDKTGLLVMGMDYAYIAIAKMDNKLELQQVICSDAENGNREKVVARSEFNQNTVYFSMKVSKGARVQFSYSTNNEDFIDIGDPFIASPGKWIGAKVGLFCIADGKTNNAGYANVDWFRIEK